LEDEEPEGDGDEDMLGPDDSDEDAEGEDDDMDELQEDHPPPPVIKDSRKGKPNVTVSGPLTGPLKSVEDKEMEDDDDDDDELSELDSLDEEPNEGEGGDDDEEEEEEEEDSDGENSRSATPDLAKLTKRQRGAVEFENVDLLALSNEAQKKKHLTAEEHAMRRAEMARRRKNLSEKRNEEEKVLTWLPSLPHDNTSRLTQSLRWKPSTSSFTNRPPNGARVKRLKPLAPQKLVRIRKRIMPTVPTPRF
jgi:Ino eighty subunit 2